MLEIIKEIKSKEKEKNSLTTKLLKKFEQMGLRENVTIDLNYAEIQQVIRLLILSNLELTMCREDLKDSISKRKEVDKM